MRLLLTTLLLTSLGSTAATAENAATSIVKTETQAGQYYSSQLSLDQGFPFSDIVETNGGLVFLSGLVGTDETGELVPGGLEAADAALVVFWNHAVGDDAQALCSRRRARAPRTRASKRSLPSGCPTARGTRP